MSFCRLNWPLVWLIAAVGCGHDMTAGGDADGGADAGPVCAMSYCDPTPLSTLLPPGTTSLDFTMSTGAAAHCTWTLGPNGPPHDFVGGEGATAHTTTFIGLSPDTTVVNEIYVTCDSGTGWPLHLRYRDLPAIKLGFPRIANLWGSQLVKKNGGIPHCARIPLWLGADFSEPEIAQLRDLNKNVLVLGSINTIARTADAQLPESAYLHDTKGNRIAGWPGAWRLNMTRPEVPILQAQYAYDQMIKVDLALDGMFFDNFFLSTSGLKTDYQGNPIEIDADGDGKADDPKWLDDAFRAGVFAELAEFRRLMPNAYTTGHLPSPPSDELGVVFNGNSLLFAATQVIDGLLDFRQLWNTYQAWWTIGRKPVITDVEGASPYQLGYGYGYDPTKNIPAATLEFARTDYRYMRFGLGTALMNDGYSLYDFGDTFHGNDWWYDEYDANLGAACGPAQRVAVVNAPPSIEHMSDGGFEGALAPNWNFSVDKSNGAAASVTLDTAVQSAGAQSARVDVTNAGDGTSWKILLAQSGRSITQGVTYDLTFAAKASTAMKLGLNFQKGASDWRPYGLTGSVDVTTTWQTFTLTFQATETASDARLGFGVGSATGSIWIDAVSMKEHPADVYRRDFEGGAAVLNGTKSTQAIDLGAGFSRLSGTQAPRVQTILDDGDAAFTAPTTFTSAVHDSGLWKAAGPYFHDWAGGSHVLASGTDAAQWDLGIDRDDTYTLSAWWAASPTGWTKAAVFEVVAGGVVVATKTLDQTTTGDTWHSIATVALKAADHPLVRIHNAGTGTLVVDAILLESQARWNDASAVSTVTLNAHDAIVLGRNTRGCP